MQTERLDPKIACLDPKSRFFIDLPWRSHWHVQRGTAVVGRGFSSVRWGRWMLTVFVRVCVKSSRSSFPPFLLPLCGLLVDQHVWRYRMISAHHPVSRLAGRSR